MHAKSLKTEFYAHGIREKRFCRYQNIISHINNIYYKMNIEKDIIMIIKMYINIFQSINIRIGISPYSNSYVGVSFRHQRNKNTYRKKHPQTVLLIMPRNHKHTL